MIQTLLTFTIVGIAFAIATVQIFRNIKLSAQKGGCSSCGCGCSSSKAPTLPAHLKAAKLS